ncbi:MAG: DUF4272 domain-containing protein [Gammaproteobacteria bacterium]|nr:DUF4272 domain-containing protein [Gammaproteobacteria bacterium]
MKIPEHRKAESMSFLQSKGVEVIDHLPHLESEAETRFRSGPDAARRAICLILAADFALGHADESYWQYIKKHSLRHWFTPQEWKFLKSKRPDEQIKINMSWRIEAAYLLLWALGKIDELPFPSDPINPDDVYACLPPFDQSPIDFVEQASLIAKADVLDKADLIYRMHWATRHASLDQKAMPGGLQDGIVKEWHHAVNWLICYGNSNWDDVTTDT